MNRRDFFKCSTATLLPSMLLSKCDDKLFCGCCSLSKWHNSPNFSKTNYTAIIESPCAIISDYIRNLHEEERQRTILLNLLFPILNPRTDKRLNIHLHRKNSAPLSLHIYKHSYLLWSVDTSNWKGHIGITCFIKENIPKLETWLKIQL